MHTSTYTDVMDEFKETIVKNDGKLFYQYGEELRPVDSSSVTLKYKDGESLKEKHSRCTERTTVRLPIKWTTNGRPLL